MEAPSESLIRWGRVHKDIITQEIMSFHPNFNEMTLFLKTSDILRFIEELGYTYHTVTL